MATDTDDGTDAELAEPIPTGTALGAYSITRRVGSGGMAVLYAAQHQSLGKRVAIKVLHASHAQRPEVARRFAREGEAAARLSHPNVVEVFDVGTHPKVGPYLVMEFLDGEDLGRHLARRGRLSVEEIADLMVPVLSAIVAAHAAGVVHRDLKPDNIFLCTKRGRTTPKVVDFGISKFDGASYPPLTTALTQSRVLLGTPSYMSPEQARGERHIDGRTDQFSLGVILFECATGRRPFEAESLYGILTAIVEKTPERPTKLAPLPLELEKLIMRALAKRPEERFTTTREFGRALLQFASPNTRLNYASDFDGSEAAPNAPDAVPRPLRESSLNARLPVYVRVLLRPAVVGTLGMLALAGVAVVIMEGRFGRGSKGPAGHAQMAPGIATIPANKARLPPVVASEAEALRAASATATYSLNVVVSPPHAQISLDGKALAIGSFTAEMLSDGRTHQLSASATGYDDWSVRFQDALAPQRVVLKRSALLAVPAERPTLGQPTLSSRGPSTRDRPAAAKPTTPRPAPPTDARPPSSPSLAPGSDVAPKKPASIDTSDPYAD